MLNRVKRKIAYWEDIIERQRLCNRFSRGRQVGLHAWSRPCVHDAWLMDFIEKRGLLDGKPGAKIGLYSIFSPFWLSRLDGCDARIFVERENLHKPQFQGFLHRYLDDERVQLSIGFDELKHPAYFHLPFWVMWSVFPPTATREEIRQQVERMNRPAVESLQHRHFCCFVCSHDDVGRRKIYDQLSGIGEVHCPGRLFHNNDDLKEKYNDDKLAYLTHYRFNLTPENSNYEGYVTEKLFEAIASGCIPIYHGSNNRPEPEVLNQDAIVFVEMGQENAEAMQQVAELNANEKRYLEFACQPRFVPGASEVIWAYYDGLEKKLREVIANI